MELEGELGYAGRKRREEIEDTSSSVKWGTQHISAYRPLLGNFPDMAPDDRTGAQKIVGRIDGVLERGGWTRGEWRRLHRLRNKWQRRTAGEDARFVVVGTYRGGLTEQQKVRVKEYEETLQSRKIIQESQKQTEALERERTATTHYGNKQRDKVSIPTESRPGRARSKGTYGWGE